MVDGGLDIFFGLKRDLAKPKTVPLGEECGELSDAEIRRMVAKPGDSPQVIEHKLRTQRALEGFDKHEQRQRGRPVIVESTSDSVADLVAVTAKGPSARQTIDILAEHLWWLTQGAEGWPFPEGRAARTGYWNAARKVLAQVGNDAWRAASDACLLILREPTADERKWQERCSSPHGWIGNVVKRVIGERVAEVRAAEWYDDVSADVDAQALWAKVHEHLSETLIRLNMLELQGGKPAWRDGCLWVSFPLGKQSMVAAGRLEATAEGAASRICEAHVEVRFECELVKDNRRAPQRPRLARG